MGKALKQITAGTLGSRKTMQGQAQELGGSWMVTGDLGFSTRYLQAVRRVTCEDVRRVARTYLTAENRTRCALLPEGGRTSRPPWSRRRPRRSPSSPCRTACVCW